MIFQWRLKAQKTKACSGNPAAARLSGISVRSSLLLAYTLAGCLAAIAGVLMTAQLNAGSADYGTSGLELQAIAAAVIGGASLFGGTGSIGLTLVGSLIIVEIENGLDLQGVPATWKNISLGLIIVVAVGIDGWRSEFAGLARLFRPHRVVAPTAGASADGDSDDVGSTGAAEGSGDQTSGEPEAAPQAEKEPMT